MDLNELQRDALGEVFNIGVGRAASSLSQIVNDTVLLSAPEVMLVHRSDAAKVLLGSEFRQFSTVSQHFSGAFDAEAMLVFPESNALEIVRLMVGPHMSIEELSEFEQEAMCEVGNIILNACMSALADLFHLSLNGTLPIHRFGDTESLAFLEGDEQQMIQPSRGRSMAAMSSMIWPRRSLITWRRPGLPASIFSLASSSPSWPRPSTPVKPTTCAIISPAG